MRKIRGNKVLKYTLMLTLIIIIYWLFIPITLNTISTGGYNTISTLMWCTKEGTCIHEVGHWKDDKSDWISNTIEFQEAVDNFIMECTENRDTSSYCVKLVMFPGINGNELNEKGWGGYGELYAEMYVYNLYYKEPLPNIFIEFYKQIGE